jgi:hypothetical protein
MSKLAPISFLFAFVTTVAGCAELESAAPAATASEELAVKGHGHGGKQCIRTGCGGDVCADHSVITTCELRPESICFKHATCEPQTDGECGFDVTADVQQCLDEVHAGKDIWLSMLPRQCGTNPWEKNAQSTEKFPHLRGELASIAAFYASVGVSFEELGLVEHGQLTAVCLSCSCPRGDRLMVKVNAFQAQQLKQLGFKELSAE